MEKEVYKSLINYDTRQPAALCSILNWKGSVPRKDYPAMLVSTEPPIIGTVGGGRMEFEVIEKAKEILISNVPSLCTFDLTSDEVEGDSGICGGSTTILIEPFTQDTQKFYQSIKLLDGKSGLIIISFNKIQLNTHREWIDINTTSSFQELKDQIDTNLNVQTFEDEESIKLIQKVLPLPILHIFGGGHVGKSVADLAHFIELSTHIYDDRSEFLVNDRFPFSRISKINYMTALSTQVNISSHDYVLVATRGHKHDLEIMRWLLKKKIHYLSLISSQRKWNLLKNTLNNEGFTDQELSMIHSPVGLDIDAQTVPEIAVSIISEVIHHYRKGNKSSLSLSY